MRCPICEADLEPLDLVSRNEHVDMCVEIGPSTLELNDLGQVIVKKNVPPGKQRKICPICDKTFQSIVTHFKVCAIKSDVPPDLMLEYWDRINANSKKPKKFPRELLDNFVARCVKDGRLGEQVDFARALSLSMAEGEGEPSDVAEIQLPSIPEDKTINDRVVQNRDIIDERPSVDEVLMQNRAHTSGVQPVAPRPQAKQHQKYRLELVSDTVKRTNVALRLDRELAASRIRRYQEALRDPKNIELQDEDDDDDCRVVQDDSHQDLIDADKLFFKARMKDCNGSEACRNGSCTNHELLLLLDEFVTYTGDAMEAPPADKISLPTTSKCESKRMEAESEEGKEHEPNSNEDRY